MNIHQIAVDHAIGQLEAPFRQYVAANDTVDFLSPLSTPFWPIEPPYDGFSYNDDSAGKTTFWSLSDAYWKLFGTDAEYHFFDELTERIREIVIGVNDHTVHVEASLGQQEYMAEGETAA